MMIVKITGGENAPDHDARKTHTLLSNVIAVDFTRDPFGTAEARVTFATGPMNANTEVETFPVPGNAYVMNEDGKTISSFGSAPYVPYAPPDPDAAQPLVPETKAARHARSL